jgi:hypothetical protein
VMVKAVFSRAKTATFGSKEVLRMRNGQSMPRMHFPTFPAAGRTSKIHQATWLILIDMLVDVDLRIVERLVSSAKSSPILNPLTLWSSQPVRPVRIRSLGRNMRHIGLPTKTINDLSRVPSFWGSKINITRDYSSVRFNAVCLMLSLEHSNEPSPGFCLLKQAGGRRRNWEHVRTAS